MPSSTLNLPASAFDGDGKFIRQNRTENIYGHVCIRMMLLTLESAPSEHVITFTLSERSIPKIEWSVIEDAIKRWCIDNVKIIGGWRINFEVFDGSWQAGAISAHDRAARHALNDATKKAIRAGVLPDPA